MKKTTGFIKLYGALAANDWAVNLVGGLVGVLFLQLIGLFSWSEAPRFFALGTVILAPFYLYHLYRLFHLLKGASKSIDSFSTLDLKQKMQSFHRFAGFPQQGARMVPVLWLLGGGYAAGYAWFVDHQGPLVCFLAFCTLAIMAPIAGLVTGLVLRRLTMRRLRTLMRQLPESVLVDFSFYRMSSFTKSAVSVFYMTLIGIFFVSQTSFFTGSRILKTRLTGAAEQYADWISQQLGSELNRGVPVQEALTHILSQIGDDASFGAVFRTEDGQSWPIRPASSLAGDIHVIRPVEPSGELHLWMDSGRDAYLWQTIRKGGWLFVLLMLGVGVIVLFQVGRDYRGTVTLLRREAESVAQGDLTRSSGLHATDEFWEIYCHILQIKHHSAHILMEIRDTARSLTGTSRTVESVSRFLQDLAIQSSRELQNASDALTFVDGFGDQVHESVSVLARSAETTSATVTQFATAVNQIKSSMAELVQLAELVSRWVRESGLQIVDLQTNLKGISDFTSRIQDSSEAQSAYYDELQRSVDTLRAVSQRAVQHSEHDSQAMQKIQAGADTLADTIRSLTESRRAMDDELSDVREIVDLVEDFVDQAQILALNAAIIAAKTDTRESGFGVIADEIRNLAADTETSTSKVRGIVDRMLKGMDEMDAETRKAPAIIEDLKETATLQEQHVDSFHRDVKHHGELVNDIARKTTQQTQLLREVVEGTRSAHQQLLSVTDALQQLGNHHNDMIQTSEEMRETAEQVLSATQEQTTGANHLAGESERIRDLAISSEEGVGKLKETLSELVATIGNLRETGEGMTRQSNELKSVAEKLGSQTRTLTEAIARFQLPRHTQDD